MKSVRRLVFYVASAVGVWLLVSFAGAMLDSANAAFWSDSLMWALLSSLIVAPALLMVYNAFSDAPKDTSSRSEPNSDEDQTSFVEEEERGEMRTLWPEPETEPNQEDDWPSQDAYEDQERIGA
jgi:hypothetical protein